MLNTGQDVNINAIFLGKALTLANPFFFWVYAHYILHNGTRKKKKSPVYTWSQQDLLISLINDLEISEDTAVEFLLKIPINFRQGSNN